ncbi:MAG TPA: CoA-binding protein [Dehalococcoidales bacterium]
MTEVTKELLDNATVIAVVGLSDSPTKISYVVARYMQEHGYKIIPVNPTISQSLGEKAYPSLRDIPGKVDIVNVFRRSGDIPPVADDAIAIQAKGLWLQQGITNDEAAKKAEAAGLKVVQDCCIMVEHARLAAGL